jgi:glc operon protein GlcG
MRKILLISLAVCTAAFFAAETHAQGPMMYGPEISLDNAKKAAAAASAEAKKNNWHLVISVVGPSGHLVYLERMDNTQFASIRISEHKARVAATYRRPTRAFAEAIGKGAVALLTLDDVIASPGGIPIVQDGKIVGALGCSGATGDQDHQACQAGADAVK